MFSQKFCEELYTIGGRGERFLPTPHHAYFPILKIIGTWIRNKFPSSSQHYFAILFYKMGGTDKKLFEFFSPCALKTKSLRLNR
jgi:hypothetical protein